jgi:hypothetical protein
MGGIKETLRKMNADLKKKIERRGRRSRTSSSSPVKEWAKGVGAYPGTCFTTSAAQALTACDCNTKINVVKSHSLLEPDACPLQWNEETKTTISGEIVELSRTA